MRGIGAQNRKRNYTKIQPMRLAQAAIPNTVGPQLQVKLMAHGALGVHG